jgi:transcriptional regulator with XRE-family HTH domain
MAIRATKGLSQQDIAAKVGCSQSRISKLERSNDEDIRLGDLRDYLKAIDFDHKIIIHKKSWPATEQIKFHACRIRECLLSLVDLATVDPSISDGVQKFHVETLVNLMKVVVDSAEKLPNFSIESPDVVEANCFEDVTDGEMATR